MTGAEVVSPRGPLAVADGAAWFDGDAPDLAPALAVVDAVLADAPAERPRVVFGSSQGAALALACALRPAPRPRLDAVVALAGFLPDPDALTLDATPADDRPAVLLWAAHDDAVVPPVRVRAAGRVLARHGLEVEVQEGPGGHEVSAVALGAAAAWLARRLPT